jgi:hypothetical protein
MPKLDDLWFDLKINDSTEATLKSIQEKLQSYKGIELNIDPNKLKSSIKECLKGQTFKIGVVVDKASISKVIQQTLNSVSTKNSGISYSADQARYDREQDKHAISLERQRAAAARAEKAELSLAQAHERAATATDRHSNSSNRLRSSLQSVFHPLDDLRNQMMMIVSLYSAEHLIRNIVMIGGEFEKQKLAMGSMLGSLEQADDIFNRMKNLALTSPFNFKDLSNYSRQLAAYGTDYKDLYDTTNRLADISAGLGGDMSRLVLAFSQVKAASFLRGQEMRQFTEFGVGLPEMLAEKYTKAEGRIVTAGDVIERVSKRMVSFNDVKDVLWNVTDKGGKFYGMQDVLSQSVSGMASNLKDAIDTMYYDIAN